MMPATWWRSGSGAASGRSMRRRSRLRGWTMTDDAVSVWCFAGKDMWALTDAVSGHALPAERPQGTRSELRVQPKGEGPIIASWPDPATSTRRKGPLGRFARPPPHSQDQRHQVDRKNVVEGNGVPVRVDAGCRRGFTT